MADPFIGQLMTVGFNFAPRGWAFCEGQLLPIAQNTALFSLLGTTFGGDGRTTFGLPDLRGRSVVGVGNGPGLSSIRWGQKGGAEQVTLTVLQLPSHNHTATLYGEREPATTSNPTGNMLAGAPTYDPLTTRVAMNAEAISVSNTGGSQPIQIRNPFLGMYVCIALQGIFPSRS